MNDHGKGSMRGGIRRQGLDSWQIYEKLEVRNRVDLYALAVERGWVKGTR